MRRLPSRACYVEFIDIAGLLVFVYCQESINQFPLGHISLLSLMRACPGPAPDHRGLPPLRDGIAMTDKTLTTAAGAPVANNNHSLTAGPRGPRLLQDVWLIDKLAQDRKSTRLNPSPVKISYAV